MKYLILVLFLLGCKSSDLKSVMTTITCYNHKNQIRYKFSHVTSNSVDIVKDPSVEDPIKYCIIEVE